MRAVVVIGVCGLMAVGCAMPVEDVAARPEALAGVFRPAARGCAMAHCDPRMSDLVGLPAPTDPNSTVLSHDTGSLGSHIALGCVSNGTRVACTYRNFWNDNLVVYDAHGVEQWASGSLLGPAAAFGAAMIDDEGGVIATDSTRSIRFDPDGTVVWNRSHTPGMPISAVPMANHMILLAKRDGPVSTIDPYTGIERHVLSGYDGWDTINTPGVRGNRAYIAMQNSEDEAILLAVDVSLTGRLTPAWQYAFHAPSGASPLVIGNRIYFDGETCTESRWGRCTATRPAVFGIRDRGTYASNVFPPRLLLAPVSASFVQDPVAGFWMYEIGRRFISRRNEWNGTVMETIDLNARMNQPGMIHIPASALSIADTPGVGPVLLVNALPSAPGVPSSTAAIAIRTHRLLWSAQLSMVGGVRDTSAGQYPIAQDEQGRSFVFTTGWRSGVYRIGVE